MDGWMSRKCSSAAKQHLFPQGPLTVDCSWHLLLRHQRDSNHRDMSHRLPGIISKQRKTHVGVEMGTFQSSSWLFPALYRYFPGEQNTQWCGVFWFAFISVNCVLLCKTKGYFYLWVPTCWASESHLNLADIIWERGFKLTVLKRKPCADWT